MESPANIRYYKFKIFALTHNFFFLWGMSKSKTAFSNCDEYF